MDHTEDLSARVLLKRILTIEPPRTPLTRRASRAQSTSGTSGPRHSNRLSIKDAVAQTPQDILRRSLKHKIQESISRKSLPATRRRTTSFVLKKANTPGPASVLFDDGDTPRHILKNILLTEPVKSPVVHEGAGSEVPHLPSVNSSLQSKRPSMELSGLELPDITMGNVVSTVKGLSRKRPRRSLNVTAFEKRLKDGNDVEENEESLDDQSSLSLSSSTSLSLKTPFMDIRTEKKGLQRRVSNRRKISEEEFGAAVNKRQMGNYHAEQGVSDSVHSEGFTLSLSKLSLPDITTDIVNCNTALYAQTDAVTSNFSTLATQDKSMVMASQLQREMEQSQLDREKSIYVLPSEEGILTDSLKECVSTMSESKKEVLADNCQPEDAEVVSTSEEDEGMKKSQTRENDDPAESEQEENAAEPQAEQDDSQTEEDAAAGSQFEDEDFVEDTQAEEEGAVESQSEEDAAANSQSEKEEDAESDQEVPVTSLRSEEVDSVTDFQSKDDDDVRQVEGEEDQGSKQLEGNLEYIRGRGHRSEGRLRGNLEYISRRAHRSEGGLIIRVIGTEGVPPDTTETGIPDDNSKAHDANHLHGNTDVGSGEISHDMTDLAKSSTRNDASCAKADPVDKSTFHLSLTTEYDSMKDTDAQDPEEEEEKESQWEIVEEVVEDWEEQMVEEKGEEEMEKEEEEVVEDQEEQMVEKGEEEMVEEEVEEEVVDGEEEGEEEMEEKVVNEEEEGEEEVVDGVEEWEEEMEEEGEEEMVDEEVEEEMVAGVEEEGEEEVVDEEEDEDEENEDIPMKTPAFVKEKRNFICPDPLASPVLKNIQSNQISEGLPGAKPKPGTRRKAGPAKKEPGLPKSYLMAVFKHFAKTKVSADVYPVLQEIMDKFFDRLAKDLEAYALHARRKTIEVEDAELLLKRQGYVNDKVPVEVLIEKYLRMEQRKLLIPIATSGNVVIPKKRR
ncbi:spore wall protein 2 [Sphaeramia orbicularis]|uniref:spore wall protein 2 n=1 Tax=Sphaeramia orbicularis TaxID=375764 RepID=UPI00117F60F7|nr:centromere protein T [Sphaeramia orbicularis]